MVLATSKMPRRIYLLTVPRCGSNLLLRMLSVQPNVDHSSYHLFHAWLGSGLEKAFNGNIPLSNLSTEDRRALDEKLQKAYEGMLDALQQAESAGNAALVKEHVFMLMDPYNIFKKKYPDDKGLPFTVRDPKSSTEQAPKEATTRTSQAILPDDLLLSFQPVFQIRHPALAFSSAVRVRQDSAEREAAAEDVFEDTLQSFHWSRNLYEWYAANGASPLVIDADDVMTEGSDAVKKLCDATGLDADKLLLSWDTRDDAPGYAKRWLSRLNGSTGIVKGLTAANLNLDEEEEKWKKEFSPELVSSLSRRVHRAMDDYEWLKARKL